MASDETRDREFESVNPDVPLLWKYQRNRIVEIQDPRGTSILRSVYPSWATKQAALAEYSKYMNMFREPSLEEILESMRTGVQRRSP